MQRHTRVALFIRTSTAAGRGILEGIRSYCQAKRNWLFDLSSAISDTMIAGLSRSAEGIIATAGRASYVRSLVRSCVPCVNVAHCLPDSLPTVCADVSSGAALAAEYLLDRGFRNFAFCGSSFGSASAVRQQAFCQRVQLAGWPCHVYYPPKTAPAPERVTDWRALQDSLARWLATLPLPVGLLAGNDSLGHQVLEVCRAAGIRVPQQVAVVGMGDDKLICRFCTPPLTSVAYDHCRVGYEAAALLDRMMAGQKPPCRPNLIAPTGVVSRQSTDTFAVDDPKLARAVVFIREHACDPISVRDILRHVSVSRRVFERRFRAAFGITPHEAIRRAQIERAKKLLVETRLPIQRIAQAAGLNGAKYLDVVFRRELGVCPSLFRTRQGVQQVFSPES